MRGWQYTVMLSAVCRLSDLYVGKTKDGGVKIDRFFLFVATCYQPATTRQGCHPPERSPTKQLPPT